MVLSDVEQFILKYANYGTLIILFVSGIFNIIFGITWFFLNWVFFFFFVWSFFFSIFGWLSIILGIILLVIAGWYQRVVFEEMKQAVEMNTITIVYRHKWKFFGIGMVLLALGFGYWTVPLFATWFILLINKPSFSAKIPS